VWCDDWVMNCSLPCVNEKPETVKQNRMAISLCFIVSSFYRPQKAYNCRPTLNVLPGFISGTVLNPGIIGYSHLIATSGYTFTALRAAPSKPAAQPVSAITSPKQMSAGPSRLRQRANSSPGGSERMLRPVLLNSREYAHDAGRHFFEAGQFLFQVFESRICGAINPNRAILRRDTDFRLEPFHLQHPLLGRIQRAFLDLQHILRNLLDVFCQSIAMHWLRPKRLQNHHFQRSRKQVAIFRISCHKTLQYAMSIYTIFESPRGQGSTPG
jgi:hypothetical protein